ncbi:hypothetical protein IF1G_09226 [Cordyceps javanica]|uniref:Uncharacterized protein n=1 Tax=Cordyceps javanica TaxID=43265 RepID=A0A545URQ4_9HYPO|nr:hypothetical protein IF1G_09226 [Cordyceps javanica]
MPQSLKDGSPRAAAPHTGYPADLRRVQAGPRADGRRACNMAHYTGSQEIIRTKSGRRGYDSAIHSHTDLSPSICRSPATVSHSQEHDSRSMTWQHTRATASWSLPPICQSMPRRRWLGEMTSYPAIQPANVIVRFDARYKRNKRNKRNDKIYLLAR